MRYVELKDKPINPNRAKWYAVLLSLAAALIALMTVKSNYDYFAQYYEGFGFWMRVIPFFAVEVAIILLPLTKGWGNISQQVAALICEVILIALSLTHTSLVGEASQAKIQAGKTKAEAQADFDKAQGAANSVAAQNQKLQDSYNRAMTNWNRAAANARISGQSPPPAPSAPQLMAVPQIDQALVSNSTLSVEQAAEAEVSHSLLLRLLYAMIAAVVASAITVVWLADASRVKAWLLRRKAEDIKQTTQETGARVVDTHEPYVTHSPTLSADATAQEPKRVAGFSQAKDINKDTRKDTKTQKDCIGVDDGLCLRTVRERLKSVSAKNPGLSFKVDGRGQQVFIRAMRAEKGSQVTEATVKLSETEAQRLVSKPEGDCKRDLVSRFESQNLHLNF